MRDSLLLADHGFGMRGRDEQMAPMFSYVSCEARVPAGHPLRVIRAIVDEALDVMSRDFEALYARVGRPSIPPEKLLRALLLQAFYGIRSERQLMEQLDYNLLFRWFVGLAMDAAVWDASTFSKNRDRLLAGDVAQRLLAAVSAQPRVKALMSSRHFSVDGTLIQAWASHKSFQPKPAIENDEPPGPARVPPVRERVRAATPSATGAAKSAATRPMRARPIQMRALPANPTASRACSPMQAMFSWRTGTGW